MVRSPSRSPDLCGAFKPNEYPVDESRVDAVVPFLVCALLVSLWSTAIAALISAVRLPDYAWRSAKRSKTGTVLGIALTGGFGGAYYWLAIHEPVKAAHDRIPPPPKRDAWSKGDW